MLALPTLPRGRTGTTLVAPVIVSMLAASVFPPSVRASSGATSSITASSPTVGEVQLCRHNGTRSTWVIAALLAHEERKAAFSAAARSGALIAYELPFLVAIVGMPPVVTTRHAAAGSSSSNAVPQSSSGVSAFFRRMVYGESDEAGVCNVQERERAVVVTGASITRSCAPN